MINVCCAIIRNDDEKVLVVQRGDDTDHPMKWEFPGGKIKQGESAEDCIVREIDEELSLDIIICGTLKEVEHDYGHKQVRLIPFVCETLMDLPVLSEHVDFKWMEINELKDVDFSEADIPVAKEYSLISAHSEKNKLPEDDSSDVDRPGIRELLSGKSGFGAIDLLTETAIENDKVLSVLFDFSLGEDSSLAFRSAYTIQKVAEHDMNLVAGYHNEIIRSMPSLKNESVIRSFLKIINLAGVQDLAEREHGILADCSFTWLNEGDSAIAIKAFAMEALFNLSKLYPELAIELVASINRNMESGSAGVKARGRMVLDRLARRK